MVKLIAINIHGFWDGLMIQKKLSSYFIWIHMVYGEIPIPSHGFPSLSPKKKRIPPRHGFGLPKEGGHVQRTAAMLIRLIQLLQRSSKPLRGFKKKRPPGNGILMDFNGWIMEFSVHSAGDDEKPWIFLGISMDESCIFGPQMHERTWHEKLFVMHLCAAPSAHSHPVIKSTCISFCSADFDFYIILSQGSSTHLRIT